MAKKILKVAGFVLLVVLGFVLLLGLIPVSIPMLESSPDPVADYDEAVQRFGSVVDAEAGILMSDKAASLLLTHGEKTDKVYVLIHGWTNSPHQWLDFGQLLFDRGNNVLVIRLPQHGLASHNVGELQHATPELLRDYGDEVVDIAAGLGDEVHVVGLSVGGVIASWIAQNREGVVRVMPISPMFGVGTLPEFVNYFLFNLASRVPNLNVVPPSEPKRDHVYPGEATWGVVNAMAFGRSLFDVAEDEKTAVSNIIMVTNANDTTVNNHLTGELETLWQQAGTSPTIYIFPKELGYPHDSIDPTSNPDADAVYVKLLELLGE